jgi:hypothetical protein
VTDMPAHSVTQKRDERRPLGRQGALVASATRGAGRGTAVWVTGFDGKRKPLRRAARYQGFFSVNVKHPDQPAEIVAQLTPLRRKAGRDTGEPYDVVAALPPGTDPAPYAAARATCWAVVLPWDAISVDRLRRDPQRPPWARHSLPLR